MKNGRRILSILLALVLVAGWLPVTVSAEAGLELEWTLENGVLTISGEGTMFDFDGYGPSPWNGDTTITKVIIEDGVTSIGDRAFMRCSNITSVSIGKSVSRIGEYAFGYCDSIEEYIVNSDNPHLAVIDGALIRDETILVRYPSGKNDVTSFHVPIGVEIIDDDAFAGNNYLSNIFLPDSLEKIGKYAFENCSALTEIDIPDSVKEIGQHAFDGCTSLVSILIPDNEIVIDMYAFARCSALRSIRLPSKWTSISAHIFEGCTSLAYVKIPDSVETIGGGAFEDCVSLTSIEIPENVAHIGDGTFKGCTSLTSVKIPKGVETIAPFMFMGCVSLQTIEIPSSVTSIYDGFLECAALSDVYYGGSEKEWEAILLAGSYRDLLRANIHYNSTMPEQTDPPAIVSELAIANKQSVLVDGAPVEFEVYALVDANGGETNYIKLRDLAFIINGTAAQFEVSWDGAVNILDGQAYTPNGSEMNTPFSGDREYRPTDAVTKVDGVVTEFDAICLEDDAGGEYNYYKLRDLGRALGFDVSWTAEQGIFIETDQPYTED